MNIGTFRFLVCLLILAGCGATPSAELAATATRTRDQYRDEQISNINWKFGFDGPLSRSAVIERFGEPTWFSSKPEILVYEHALDVIPPDMAQIIQLMSVIITLGSGADIDLTLIVPVDDAGQSSGGTLQAAGHERCHRMDPQGAPYIWPLRRCQDLVSPKASPVVPWERSEEAAMAARQLADEFEEALAKARCGAPGAADRVGLKFQFGYGPAVNFVEAGFWYETALKTSAHPDQRRNADRFLAAVRSRLAPEEVREIDRRIGEWKMAPCGQSLSRRG